MIAAAAYSFMVFGTACRSGTEKPIATGVAITSVAPACAEPLPGAVGYQLQLPESFVYWQGRPVTWNGHEGTIKPLLDELVPVSLSLIFRMK